MIAVTIAKIHFGSVIGNAMIHGMKVGRRQIASTPVDLIMELSFFIHGIPALKPRIEVKSTETWLQHRIPKHLRFVRIPVLIFVAIQQGRHSSQ